jgi:hypothetical protein
MPTRRCRSYCIKKPRILTFNFLDGRVMLVNTQNWTLKQSLVQYILTNTTLVQLTAEGSNGARTIP